MQVLERSVYLHPNDLWHAETITETTSGERRNFCSAWKTENGVGLAILAILNGKPCELESQETDDWIAYAQARLGVDFIASFRAKKLGENLRAPAHFHPGEWLIYEAHHPIEGKSC